MKYLLILFLTINVAHAQENIEILYNKAVKTFDQEDWNQAYLDFRNVIKVDNKNYDAYIGAALSLYNIGSNKKVLEAKKMLKKANEIVTNMLIENPDNRKLQTTKARIKKIEDHIYDFYRL